MPRRTMLTAGSSTIAIAAASLFVAVSPASAAVPHYKNCTAMRHVYPHGVGRKGAHDKVARGAKPVTNFHVSTAIYNANKGSDRDKDGIACEMH